VHAGFKLFFDEDVAKHHRLMTPTQVLALAPRPEYVMYERRCRGADTWPKVGANGPPHRGHGPGTQRASGSNRRRGAPMNNPKTPAASSTTPEKRTIVEEGTALKGSITSTCPILVQGSIEGEVVGPSLDGSATGNVSGKVTTGTLNCKGRIAGELDV